MATSDTPSDHADLDARVERCRRVVDVLIEVGTKLMRTLDPQFGPAPVRDPFQAYDRISRSLRLTLLIEARLAALIEGRTPAMAAKRARTEASAVEAGNEPLDRPEAAEAVQGVGSERDREGPDEVSQFLSRPMAEIAATVCRDFGLPAAEADEAQAAFADLTANDDAGDAGDPQRSEPVALDGASERDVRRRGPRRVSSRLGRRPP